MTSKMPFPLSDVSEQKPAGSPRAADLDDRLRTFIFADLRDRLGAAKFDEARKQYGDDAMVKLFFEISKESEAQRTQDFAGGAKVLAAYGSTLLQAIPNLVCIVVIAWTVTVWLSGGLTNWWTWLRGHF